MASTSHKSGQIPSKTSQFLGLVGPNDFIFSRLTAERNLRTRDMTKEQYRDSPRVMWPAIVSPAGMNYKGVRGASEERDRVEAGRG